MAGEAAGRAQDGDGGGLEEVWGMEVNEEGGLLLHPAPLLYQIQPHNPVRTGVMARAHGGPVRKVHPVHTGSSVGFVSFDKEGRGWG